MPTYKKNGKWFATVSYVALDGSHKKRQTKYFTTKKEAEEAEIVLKQKMKESERYSITFKEAYKEFRVYKSNFIKIQSLDKLDQLYVHIKPIENLKVEKITLQQYKAFKEEIDKKDIGNARKNKIHRFVLTIIDYCDNTYGIRNDNPRRAGGFYNKEIKKEMKFFTLDEFNRFIDTIDDIVYKTLFSLLFYNGLRIGEALALKWSDIKDNQININKTLVNKVKGVAPFASSPKTKNSNRIIPMHKEVSKLLMDLKEYYSKFDGFNPDWYVFGAIKPLSTTTITKVKDEACKSAKVKQIRIHDFRHSCASYYIKHKNAPIILISKLLGHSKISITLDTYSHMYPNELDQLMQ